MIKRGSIAYLGGGCEVSVIDLLGRRAVVEILEDQGPLIQGQLYEVALVDVHEDPPPRGPGRPSS